ncbi:HNH endonuclease [Bacillus sp. AFS088145]|uniref:HNH endonuclease n=1 Tax=Bacillus sp. AFS088145 TaxID=2033514 RepID=UPI000BF4E5CE|nr:HNH endonuclease [Bacillus sp. AFS088145]PFH81615.1 HNH endonuclease [Bacillus sp. AFS088145]
MPKSRPPKEVWQTQREMVWYRDGRRCTRCHESVELNKCHIDHIVSGKAGTNALTNLRTLCRKCHTLRSDLRHSGMKGNALKKGIIAPGWRDEVWE